jgi:hypothetical protein
MNTKQRVDAGDVVGNMYTVYATPIVGRYDQYGWFKPTYRDMSGYPRPSWGAKEKVVYNGPSEKKAFEVASRYESKNRWETRVSVTHANGDGDFIG